MSDLIEPWSLAAAEPVEQRDPFAAARRVCDRIDAIDDRVQAFVAEPDRRARLEAEARDLLERWPEPPGSGRARPPLFGLPVGVKDIVRVDGLPTRAGSALPPEALAGAQAAVVDRLRAAGALVAGKTVTAEFAVLAPGPTRNPHALGHTPGGSSSGSAAGVAAGMMPLAIGTQTVGSMIRPAAYCGIVGFKPSFGRVAIDGVIANAASFDTLGCYAVDVYGVSLLAAVLCDGWEPVAAPVTSASASASALETRPVLGIPVGPYLERAEPQAIEAFDAQVAILREAGYEVRPVPVMSDFEDLAADLFTMNRYEVARTHAAWFAEYADLYREETAAAIREGQLVPEDDYAAARRGRADFKERIADAMDAAGIDVWISPAATGPAPASLATTGSSIMCLPWSHAGLPSISLPAGFAANGLPLGLQYVARAGADELLIAWAPDLESALRTSCDG